MNINPEIIIDSEIWKEQKSINQDLLIDIAQNIISRYKNLLCIKEIEFSVLLTDNKHISSLNLQFRNKNKPTNVLSFPDLDINWRNILEFKSNNDYLYLGDIALSHEVIDVEANNAGISFKEHFIHLLIHAILHLLGYDHEEEKEAKIMENLEIEMLSNYGIKSPY